MFSQANLPTMIAAFLTQHAKDLRRFFILLAVYILALFLALYSSVVADPDIWWHLRTGQWILDHHTVPFTDPFSSPGAGKPWIAYSWLFEILLYALYQRFGLMAIHIYKIPLLLGILWSVLALARRLKTPFPATIGFSFLTLLAIAPLLTPRPWLLTILFFALELNILLHFRQTGNTLCLYWLLPLFALWANLHIQFIYGFIPLTLVLAEPVIEDFLRRPFSRRWIRTAGRFRAWWMIPACFVATLATPYHLHLYRPVLEYTQQTAVFQYIQELQSMNFRSPAHWAVLGLTLWAAYRLGLRQERRAFPMLFFLIAALLAFRANRDVWVVVLAAVTILGLKRPAGKETTEPALPRPMMLVVFCLGCFAAVLLAKRYDITEPSLQQEVEKNYPVAAARIVEERGYQGPLYNHFNWGGYFIWRLPHLPVSMDGRTNLYGEERIKRSLDTWNGKPSWVADPELNAAALVIAEVKMPLCSLLRLDRRFELVYEDAVAAIFLKRAQP